MPGRFFLTDDTRDVAALFDATVTGFELTPRYNVAPGQDIVVCLPDRSLTRMRWGIIPVGRVNARGRPVMETIVNARSESLFEKSAFKGVRRCLVPVNGWYEWTGKPRRKTPWRIRPRAGGLIAFAAICDVWNAPNGTELFQVATVTCAPSEDVKDIHDRMGVIVANEDFDCWLHGPETEAAGLMRPTEAGFLCVHAANGVDWNGP